MSLADLCNIGLFVFSDDVPGPEGWLKFLADSAEELESLYPWIKSDALGNAAKCLIAVIAGWWAWKTFGRGNKLKAAELLSSLEKEFTPLVPTLLQIERKADYEREFMSGVVKSPCYVPFDKKEACVMNRFEAVLRLFHLFHHVKELGINRSAVDGLCSYYLKVFIDADRPEISAYLSAYWPRVYTWALRSKGRKPEQPQLNFTVVLAKGDKEPSRPDRRKDCSGIKPLVLLAWVISPLYWVAWVLLLLPLWLFAGWVWKQPVRLIAWYREVRRCRNENFSEGARYIWLFSGIEDDELRMIVREVRLSVGELPGVRLHENKGAKGPMEIDYDLASGALPPDLVKMFRKLDFDFKEFSFETRKFSSPFDQRACDCKECGLDHAPVIYRMQRKPTPMRR